MLNISRLTSAAADFEHRFAALLRADTAADEGVEATVRDIIGQVRSGGDAAVLALTARLDGRRAESLPALRVPADALEDAFAGLGAEDRGALEAAEQRIRAYHARQRQASWSYEDEYGSLLGQQVSPLDRVGVYVPGGKASYPSTVLMNVVPARVAGVPSIVMTVPAGPGGIDPLVLAAAHLTGVDEVFAIGGAQAVAALAFGTETIAPVDKIVGPGNAYVAEAKRALFGVVGIDMVAGPSEIAIVCDGGTDPDWIAMDLFSQAEHDEHARSLLLCPEEGFLDAVEARLQDLLPGMERAAIIGESLRARGALIHVADLGEAMHCVNRIAPEHLELSVADPQRLLPLVRNAGAVFLGAYTSEVLGDYCAGPNHVLPTARTARFASPLGVYDFQKRTSIIGCSRLGASELGAIASILARREGLTAHARSAELRIER